MYYAYTVKKNSHNSQKVYEKCFEVFNTSKYVYIVGIVISRTYIIVYYTIVGKLLKDSKVLTKTLH